MVFLKNFFNFAYIYTIGFTSLFDSEIILIVLIIVDNNERDEILGLIFIFNS
ncbi:hypothetical protein RhiirA1_418433 [Rhizophagus irregularis]|uniref:Uncharacterized protein n=1 Tax=Rhizophagus irregularis TaxID=588596 RepID=A0A2N0RV74_9GLOM|nr:hypothetical protein RhiirA1_418433 [Rhizophagus irregularis]GET57669.1 hypothetical protein RIR_e28151_A0A2N0RV74_9GLOM [Rhizophagus irregularis DAOM 181602=DAOM 197198]